MIPQVLITSLVHHYDLNIFPKSQRIHTLIDTETSTVEDGVEVVDDREDDALDVVGILNISI